MSSLDMLPQWMIDEVIAKQAEIMRNKATEEIKTMSLSDLEKRQRFTVLEIMIMLHYNCYPERYANHDKAHSLSESVTKAHRKLITLGLIEPADVTSGMLYMITDKGRVYVDKLQTVGMPEARWGYPA